MDSEGIEIEIYLSFKILIDYLITLNDSSVPPYALKSIGRIGLSLTNTLILPLYSIYLFNLSLSYSGK